MSIKHKSLYFQYQEYPFVEPPEMDGVPCQRSVTVVGAGPVGLVTALSLVRQGIEVTIIEDEATLNIGSRAAGASRRTLEILDSLGVNAALMEKGVAWSRGQTYYGDKLVLDFSIPASDDIKHPPMLNVQQCYVEKFILDELVKSPLATIMWSSVVKGVANQDDHVLIQVDTPSGAVRLKSDWLVACDGARSAVRGALGLNLEGTSYEGRYIIADVRLATDLPPGRRVWFDSPGNPGSTIILHRQPDNIWRIDYQLRDDEDSAQELKIERINSRIQSFLDAVGIEGPWEMDWFSLYRAHSLSLRDYWHGRVLFAGDSAHLVPIFGARGMNGGIDDAYNLAWKLAYVVKGLAPANLLTTYSEERRFAFSENIRNADKSTKVMAPPTRGDLLLRDAVLELAVEHEFVRPLLNPRQSQEIMLAGATLNDVDEMRDDKETVLGRVCPNVQISVRCAEGKTERRYLQDMLGEQFTLLVCTGAESPLIELQDTVHGLHIKTVRICRDSKHALENDIIDVDGAIADMLRLKPGDSILVRPDQHLMARWVKADASKISAALHRVATWK
ncbi:hypothetical protein CSC67_03510 [Pusillimonas caeni]|uniref:FAD-dependent monooxygenase n=1 Tax=Pusillimonas caeni TaxID=1348472 RepID=UPI000E59F65D|nr:FAD-dependent monooxygenase [Pusillimonas caeni]TFL15803.1 hypothetical protein CSC67_03510 [Pusillimonas caeni]